MLLIKVSP